MYKGTIIENSLADRSILDRVKITRTWQSGNWTLHDVEVDENQLKDVGKCLAPGPWYVHFWKPGEKEVIVIFKDKDFKINYLERSTWKDAVHYGKSIGIPEEQLDFPIN